MLFEPAIADRRRVGTSGLYSKLFADVTAAVTAVDPCTAALLYMRIGAVFEVSIDRPNWPYDIAWVGPAAALKCCPTYGRRQRTDKPFPHPFACQLPPLSLASPSGVNM